MPNREIVMAKKADPKLSLTSLTPTQAAQVLASAYGKRVDPGQVQAIAEEGDLLRADGTLNLMEYVAYLASEMANKPSH
ncbi:hypothetical protein KS4_10790 [Poriferisphaera corsica]|uniref:Uncharacterized protein n=1 Tax=Poriferisphaera corsica TaxID=2528020 RepID=A0A517YS46_9BACT|nr:hypothetical protein [Poriferisphaera corsica]QDU33038.1 hypothetical protein KS4_10790 [Poriferisphaera corsica]